MPPAHPRVRLLSITVRMRPTSGVTLGVVKAASHVLERFGGKGGARSQVGDDAAGNGAALWASLARYDDALVDTLERWERWSRDAAPAGGMGILRAGGNVMHGEGEDGQERLRELFVTDKWDGKKMVRSFARMKAGSAAEKVREGKGKGKTPAKPVSEDEQEDGSDDEEAEDEYVVDKILEHKFAARGVVQYKVKWLGYDDEADMTWEPAENL